MDGAEIAGPTLATDKAFTAVAHRIATAELGPLTVDGGPLQGMQANGGGRYVVFAGGLPCWDQAGDRVVGGIGVSGGSAEEDAAIAAAGLAVHTDSSAVVSRGLDPGLDESVPTVRLGDSRGVRQDDRRRIGVGLGSRHGRGARRAHPVHGPAAGQPRRVRPRGRGPRAHRDERPGRPRAVARASRTAGSSRWTAPQEADFDSLDAFIATHGIDVAVAEEAMALDDVALRPTLRRPGGAPRRARPAVRGHDAGQARPGHGAAAPGRAHPRHDQDAGPAHPVQPGARHQPPRRPAAARRRRGHRRRLRLPRDRDHGAGARRRPLQRGRGHDRRRASAPPASSCSARSRRRWSSRWASAASCRTPRRSASTAPRTCSSTATTPRTARRSWPRRTPAGA